MVERDDGVVVPVSEDGVVKVPEVMLERRGIDTPGSVRVTENDDGEIVIEPVPSITEMRGAASTDEPGTRVLREDRREDRGGDL